MLLGHASIKTKEKDTAANASAAIGAHRLIPVIKLRWLRCGTMDCFFIRTYGGRSWRAAGFSLGGVSLARPTAIGNLQQWLLGTHHGVSRAQLQVYLDEFVFRHNRRKQPMAAFQTLLGLGTMHGSTHYASIRSAKDLSKRLPKANHNM